MRYRVDVATVQHRRAKLVIASVRSRFFAYASRVLAADLESAARRTLVEAMVATLRQRLDMRPTDKMFRALYGADHGAPPCYVCGKAGIYVTGTKGWCSAHRDTGAAVLASCGRYASFERKGADIAASRKQRDYTRLAHDSAHRTARAKT